MPAITVIGLWCVLTLVCAHTGDGNCLYRAFVVAVLEGIQASGNEVRVHCFAEALTAAYSALGLSHATPPANNTAAQGGYQRLQVNSVQCMWSLT